MRYTAEQIYSMLAAIPALADKVTYRLWKKAPDEDRPQMPYAVFYSPYETPFAADNVVYYSIPHYQIELYSYQTAPELEAAIEATLTGADIVWRKNKEYLDDQQCWCVIYEFEVY